MNVNLFSCFRIKYVGSKPYLGSKAYLHHSPLDSFTGFLVLSSDGLYQHMPPSALPNILFPSAASPADRDTEQSSLSSRELPVEANVAELPAESSARCRGVAKRLLDEALARATKASRKHRPPIAALLSAACLCSAALYSSVLCRTVLY